MSDTEGISLLFDHLSFSGVSMELGNSAGSRRPPVLLTSRMDKLHGGSHTVRLFAKEFVPFQWTDQRASLYLFLRNSSMAQDILW